MKQCISYIIKMKLVDLKSSKYIDFNKENKKRDLRFEVCDYVKISKYKIFLQKLTIQISLKKFLWLKKLKILSHGHTLSNILMVKKPLQYLQKRFPKNKLKRV